LKETHKPLTKTEKKGAFLRRRGVLSLLGKRGPVVGKKKKDLTHCPVFVPTGYVEQP